MMTKISKGFYMGSIYGGFIAGIAFTVLSAFLIYNMVENLQNPLSFRYGPPIGTLILTAVSYILGVWFMAYGFMVENILIYRIWDVIRDKKTRTTPGRAVAFLYAPLFAFYWI